MTPRLFGTNGVRGVANADLTPELALRLGKAVASWLPEGSRVGVGRDARTTGPMFGSATIAGLVAAGARVIDLGVGPTPALQYYVKTHTDVQAALIITASHNPPEFNGLKLISGDGTEASQAEEAEVERRYFSEAFRRCGWKDLAPVATDDSANEAYLAAIVARTRGDALRTRPRPLKVVVDTGGGAGGLTTPPLLRRLGCKVVALNEALDGTFAARKSEPTEENLAQLKDAVRREGADVGIAHDGDADRCIFIDERGSYVPGEVSLALLAQETLERTHGGVVCTPVSSSSLIEEVVRKLGGVLRWTAVGSPIVARAMMEAKAVFGGEENGGVIFPEHQYCRDAAMTAARMAEFLARTGRPLSEHVAALPKYFVTKLKFQVPESAKPMLVGRLRAWVGSAHPKARVDETDGLKVFFDDEWVLIRPSGTEPIFRVYAEAKKADRARALADVFIAKASELANQP